MSVSTKFAAKGFLASILLLLCLLFSSFTPTNFLVHRASAQQLAASEDEPTESDVNDVSPRASMREFLSLARAGKYGDASRFLEIPRGDEAQAGTLARRLYAVLDRNLRLDLDEFSPEVQGRSNDGLAASLDEVGRFRLASGADAVVRLHVATIRGIRAWRFSRATVERTNDWFDQLRDRWMVENLSPPLLRRSLFDIYVWQWISAPLVLALAWILGSWMSKYVVLLLTRLARRTSTDFDDTLFLRNKGPVRMAATLGLVAAAVPFLRLDDVSVAGISAALRAAFTVVIFWALLRSIDVLSDGFGKNRIFTRNPGARALLPLLGRIFKVVLVLFAFLALLSQLGYSVGTVLAGLGIGGVAVALGAQKTFEHLFGAFAIGVDQPFKEGDTIRCDAVTGTVERVGLRSTSIRTADRTLVTIPNGSLADKVLENFASRDRILFKTIVRLVFETKVEQLRSVREELEKFVRMHPKTFQDTVVVHLTSLAENSLDIEVMVWILTSDYEEFRKIREDFLLGFVKIVERAGARFAYGPQAFNVDQRLVPDESL